MTPKDIQSADMSYKSEIMYRSNGGINIPARTFAWLMRPGGREFYIGDCYGGGEFDVISERWEGGFYVLCMVSPIKMMAKLDPEITFENFKGQNCTFVTKWLEEK